MPVFAEENYNVFARIVYQFRGNEWFPRNDENRFLSIVSGAEDNMEVALPVGTTLGLYSSVIPLGRGTGGLERRKLIFETHLDSVEAQRNLQAVGRVSRPAFFILRELAVFSLPAVLPETFSVSAGLGVEPWIHGFHAPEEVDAFTFRWSRPEAGFDLPPASREGLYRMKIHTTSSRPVSHPSELSWSMNGEKIAIEDVLAESDDGIVTYVLEPVLFSDTEKNRVKMHSAGWNPQRDSGIPDSRNLGIGFVGMDIEFAVEKSP